MIKTIFSLFLFFNFAFAKYEVIDKKNIFTIKTKDYSFKQLYVNLKDEINFQSYVIVHQLDLAKSTKIVAKALNKKAILKEGKNILICKSSFTLKMHEENIENITYCPMIISVYSDENFRYISYKKYHSFNSSDTIAKQINKRLKNIILESLD